MCQILIIVFHIFYAPALLTSKLPIVSAYKHQIQYFEISTSSHLMFKGSTLAHYFSIVRSSSYGINSGIN